MMGKKNCVKKIFRIHVTELHLSEKVPHYLWIVISSAAAGDESNVCIIAVTEC